MSGILNYPKLYITDLFKKNGLLNEAQLEKIAINTDGYFGHEAALRCH